jgi:acyl carrier protein
VNATDAYNLFAALLHRIAPEVDLDHADRQAPLQDTLDLDSMDFLNLVAALHDATGIDVPEHDYPQLASIDAFVAYIAAASANA